MTVKGKRKRVRRSAVERQAVVSRYEASGLAVSTFCRREGMSAASLYRWCRELRATRGEADVGGESATACGHVPAFLDLGALQVGEAARSRLEVKLELGDGVVLYLARG